MIDIVNELEKRRQQRLDELEAIRESPRTSHVYVASPPDCTASRYIQGTFPKDSAEIPELPFEGCSRPGGCICRYEPFVVEVGP